MELHYKKHKRKPQGSCVDYKQGKYMTMSNTTKNTPVNPASQVRPRKPNETGTISVQAHFRISDPQTQKIIVEGRG
jgi:hypothetical protein